MEAISAVLAAWMCPLSTLGVPSGARTRISASKNFAVSNWRPALFYTGDSREADELLDSIERYPDKE